MTEFQKALAKAYKAGKKTFTFKGKLYSTELKDSSRQSSKDKQDQSKAQSKSNSTSNNNTSETYAINSPHTLTQREKPNYTFLEQAIQDTKFRNDVGIIAGAAEGDREGYATYDSNSHQFVNIPEPHSALYWSNGEVVTPKQITDAYHSYNYMKQRQNFNDRGIFGNMVTNAQNHAGNKVLDAYRSGMNDVGNLAVTVGMLPGLASGLGTIYNLWNAGRYGTLAGGVLGSYLGSKAGDKLVDFLSDGRHASTYDYLTSNGFWSNNAAFMDPGAIGGGYIGSKWIGSAIDALPTVYNNMRATIHNQPRIAQLPGRGNIVLQPGEVVTDVPVSERALPPGQYTGGSVYKGRRTVGNGSGKANQFRHSYTKGRNQGGNTSPVRIGVTNVPEQQVMVVSGKNQIPQVTHPVVNIKNYPKNWFYVPMIGPMKTPSPPTTVPEPEPETRYVVEETRPSKFSEWFIKEWNTPGHQNTIQEYEGDDEGHKPGSYWIIQGGPGAEVVKSRKVGTGPEDFRGENRLTPDSTATNRTLYYNYYDAPESSRLARRPKGSVSKYATTVNIPVVTPKEIIDLAR